MPLFMAGKSNNRLHWLCIRIPSILPLAHTDARACRIIITTATATGAPATAIITITGTMNTHTCIFCVYLMSELR